MPNYLQSFTFPSRSEVHTHNTRRKNNLDTKRTRTVMATKCLRHAIPELINKTEKCIIEKVSTHSFQGFKWYTKQRFVDCYRWECLIDNCYVCQS